MVHIYIITSINDGLESTTQQTAPLEINDRSLGLYFDSDSSYAVSVHSQTVPLTTACVSIPVFSFLNSW